MVKCTNTPIFKSVVLLKLVHACKEIYGMSACELGRSWQYVSAVVIMEIY